MFSPWEEPANHGLSRAILLPSYGVQTAVLAPSGGSGDPLPGERAGVSTWPSPCAGHSFHLLARGLFREFKVIDPDRSVAIGFLKAQVDVIELVQFDSLVGKLGEIDADLAPLVWFPHRHVYA